MTALRQQKRTTCSLEKLSTHSFPRVSFSRPLTSWSGQKGNLRHPQPFQKSQCQTNKTLKLNSSPGSRPRQTTVKKEAREGPVMDNDIESFTSFSLEHSAIRWLKAEHPLQSGSSSLFIGRERLVGGPSGSIFSLIRENCWWEPILSQGRWLLLSPPLHWFRYSERLRGWA